MRPPAGARRDGRQHDPVRGAGDDGEPRRYEGAPEVLRDGTAEVRAFLEPTIATRSGRSVSDSPRGTAPPAGPRGRGAVVVLEIGRCDEPSPDIGHARGGCVGVDPEEPLPVAVGPESA